MPATRRTPMRLQVLAEILGGGAGSRLYQALVLKDAVALSAGAGYAPNALGLATFSVYAVPKPGVSVADLEAAVEAQLRNIVTAGRRCPTRSGGRQQRMQAAAIYAHDSLAGPANIVGSGACHRADARRRRGVARPHRRR